MGAQVLWRKAHHLFQDTQSTIYLVPITVEMYKVGILL